MSFRDTIVNTKDICVVSWNSHGSGSKKLSFLEKLTSIKITGEQELKSNNIDIPSDLSSCSFFIVAALINKGSKITLKNININPTRDGIVIALKKMGANINIQNQ